MNHCSLRSRFTLVGVLVFATFSISSVNALSTNPILNADTNAKAKITGIKVDTSTKIKMNANFQAEDRYKTIPSRSADWKIRLASDIEVFSKYLMRLSSRVDSTPRLSDQGKAKLKTRIVEDTVWINKKKTQLDRFTRVEAQKIPEEIRERKRGYRQLILGNRSYTKTTNKIQTQVSALRDFGMRVD